MAEQTTLDAAPELNGNSSAGAGDSPRPTLTIRELEAGQKVASVFCVRERDLRQKRNGEPFLRLVLGDRSGSVEAVSWEEPEDRYGIAEPGSALHVTGTFEQSDKWGAKIKVAELRPARDGEFSADDLASGPEIPADRLEADLRDLVATIQRPELRALLDSFFAPGSAAWRRFREAPAAKHYHQAYRHGLLEHTVSVAQAVSAAAALFPGIDRDVAVTGALLHDIGKTEAYNEDPLAIELTDAGRLLGEIPIGYYKVRRQIEESGAFEPDLAQAVLHIILSHHGALAHGSPVVPCTREAALVHAIDNLGGKLGSFDRLERELPDGQSWSSFDRALEGSAFFGSRAA
jgi:3'-5' exoribonuclease